MSDERRAPSSSEKAFVNDLPQLERELAQRLDGPACRPPRQVPTLIAGLIAGMTHVGRPVR